MNTDYYWLQSPNQSDFWIFYIKFCNNFLMTSGSKSCAYCLIWQFDWALSFAVQLQYLLKTLCFRTDYRCPKCPPTFGAFGEFSNFGKKFKPFFAFIFHFCLKYTYNSKIVEFWQIYFLTIVILESVKMNLHTSYIPFWNETSVRNLLILLNFCFFRFNVAYLCKTYVSFFLDQTLDEAYILAQLAY